MSSQMVTEGGRTKFNLTLPLPMPDTTPAANDLDGVDVINLLTSPGILIGILVPHAICTLVILIRTWSRLFLLRKWFLDDTLIALAWAFTTTICILYGVTTAQSEPASTTTNTAGVLPPAYVQGTYVPLLLYQFALLATVLSTLAFHHRLVTAASLFYPSPSPSSTTASSSSSSTTTSPGHHRRHHLAHTAIYLLPILTTAALLVLTGLQCDPPSPATATSSPPSKNATQTPLILGHQTQTCAPYQPLFLATFAAHTLLTLAATALVVVPCAMGRFAGLPARERRVLACGASCVGGVGVAVGVVRVLLVLGWLHDLSSGSDAVGGGGGGDGGGGSGSGSGMGGGGGIAVAGTGAFFVVTMAELDVLLVCACVPALRPVVARLWAVVVARGRGMRGGGGRGVGEEGSVDLTSEVSYHGYPWTRDATPVANTPSTGSKNPSVLDVGGLFSQGVAGVPPVPPPPVMMAVHRTPTTLSLRSFVSGLAPRSRGRMEGEDCTGLLGDEIQGAVDGTASRRRSSVGLEAYFEEFVGCDEGGNIKRRSGLRDEARRSRRSKSYSGLWGDSQESFVLGMNDPNSPKRLSPVLGLGEAVQTELRRPESSSEKGLEDR